SITNATAMSLSASTVGGNLLVSANGALTTTGAVSAGYLSLLTATSSNGNITLGDDVTGTTYVTVSADGSGHITQTGGTLTSALVNLSSGSGDITALSTVIDTLSVHTGGSATVINSGDLALNASTVGGTLQITTDGQLSTNAAVSANHLILTTESGS